jgi:hypothetical protein
MGDISAKNVWGLAKLYQGNETFTLAMPTHVSIFSVDGSSSQWSVSRVLENPARLLALRIVAVMVS